MFRSIVLQASLALALLLNSSPVSQATIITTSENFEGGVLGASVTVDTTGADLPGVAGGKALTGTIFNLMLTGGGTVGTGAVSARFVDNATIGVASTNASQFIELSMSVAPSGGSVGPALIAPFTGSPDGEAYIMKLEVLNPNNIAPRLATSRDVSPANGNFGWQNSGAAHSRMFDTTATTATDWESWWMVVNDSPNDINYTNPNGGSSTVLAGTVDRWIDGVIGASGSSSLGNNAEIMGIAPGAISTLPTANPFVMYADNFSIEGIPEPSTIVLLGVCGLALAFFRRKK